MKDKIQISEEQAEKMLKELKGVDDSDDIEIFNGHIAIWQKTGYILPEPSALNKAREARDKKFIFEGSEIHNAAYKMSDHGMYMAGLYERAIIEERKRAAMAIMNYVQENKLEWGESKKKLVDEILGSIKSDACRTL